MNSGMRDSPTKRAPAWLLVATVMAVLVMLAATPSRAADRDEVEIMIFAASSLAPPLEQIAALYQQRGGGKMRFAFASSAVLARQIEYGAPANLFITAHPLWLERLAQIGRVQIAAARAIAGNRLVLARTAARTGAVTVETEDIRTLLLASTASSSGTGRIATGDPGSVPLGMYARDSLTALGLWGAVGPRLAPAANARAALLQVERGLAALGILYASDVAGSGRAVVVGEMPAESYAPIQYLAVPVGERAGRPGIGEILDLLASPEAVHIFRRHGFTPPDQGQKE